MIDLPPAENLGLADRARAHLETAAAAADLPAQASQPGGPTFHPLGQTRVWTTDAPPLRLAQAKTSAKTPSAQSPIGRPLANPSLAMGLSGLSDWSSQQPFLDVMKTARPWIGHLPGQWGGWTEEDLAAKGYLDPNGWPRAIPPELSGIATLVLTDQPGPPLTTPRTYRLTYAGTGKLTVSGGVEKLYRRDNAIWFDTIPGTGNAVILTIEQTDPRGTGDHIRDIEILRRDQIPAHDAGEIFNPDWLARISDLRALRFMDWMDTNNSPAKDWSDRPRPEDHSYTPKGAPVEVMVALANRIGADPWFTLPHQATDAYIRSFAEYVRDHLDPTLKANVEYSNEVWNWQFDQAHWADTQAKARWGATAPGDAWIQFAGMRAAQMARIWDDVFGAAASTRLVKIISTQTGWQGLETPLLDAPLWVAEDPAHNLPPARAFDAYAITGYFGYPLGSDEKAALIRAWLTESRAKAEADAAARGLTGEAARADAQTHRFDLAVTRAAAELRDGGVTGDRRGSIAELVEQTFPYHAAVARAHGLRLVMYEGGTHVVGLGEQVNDPELTAFFTQLNYTPEMAALYTELLTGWKAAGGTLFNAFVDVSVPGKWGSWGALRTLEDQNPRWTVLDRFNRATPAWWETRAPGTFTPETAPPPNPALR